MTGEDMMKLAAIDCALKDDDFFDKLKPKAQVLYILLVMNAEKNGTVTNSIALTRYAGAEGADLISLDDQCFINITASGIVEVVALKED